MGYNTEKASLIHFLLVLVLLLTLALLISPVFWSFIALVTIIHIVAFALQLVVRICTTSIEILQFTAKSFLKTISVCGRRILKSNISCINTNVSNSFRKVVRNMNRIRIYFVLTFGVGFGAYRLHNLVEERPKFCLQLYIPDEPEIIPRQERSRMGLMIQTLPKSIRYRPHIPSILGPNYIEEWKELIDFYLSKKYATGILNRPGLTAAKDIIEPFAKYRAGKRTRGLKTEQFDSRVNNRHVKKLDPIEFPEVNNLLDMPRNKLIQQKRTEFLDLSPQETLNAARAQLEHRLRSHRKRRRGKMQRDSST
ncbi:12135_t:CDS:2 [Funneliformis geosporum]|uniref:13029_t:CDS:1 n=1 Tax=Funneliformis geosporum TaxID=1117311 RepID=A0A9W4WPM2_9GLOM|nr:12135_t:CDS:2 [Funneliformis geosporum]CAI2162530.1 13029_t:CDS:2 [Funneliformis geosporum]